MTENLENLTDNEALRLERERLLRDGEALRLVFERLLRTEIYITIRHRADVLRYAESGDWLPLAEYFRGGGRATPEMRHFLADVLDGTRKRPFKKISKAKTRARNYELVKFILAARRNGETDIPKKAEAKFGRTWRQLQKILAAERGGDAEEALAVMSDLDKAVGAFLKGRDLDPDQIDQIAKGVIKYQVSDMALTPHTLT